MLTQNQFAIINVLYKQPKSTQRDIAQATNLGLATVNSAMKECRDQHLVNQYGLTQEGISSLEPYKVDNAIIMAAGLSSRFGPISYEKPKGLLTVRGEILIERQIRQLQAAGINNITIVVGYKKESFFYLEDKFNVRLVINPHYADRNNNESLYLVRERLGNTYICSSDDYFEENPFESHVWGSYYAAEWSEGDTKEWCLTLGPHDRITNVTVGGSHAWYMLGHAYFDKAFSARFREILEQEHGRADTVDKLWENLYMEHIHEFDMRIRRYPANYIHEFDSLSEVQQFDPLFLENLDSEIFNNICSTLGCDINEIHDVYPLKQGLTNLSCHFATNDGEWVYRHPGPGTELLVDRQAELKALETARDLNIDHTFVYEDPKNGWKISRFVPNAKNLDAHNREQLRAAMRLAHRLHSSAAKVDRQFSFYDEGRRYEQAALERGPIEDPNWTEMSEQASRLNDYLVSEGGEPVLCHNDFFGLNFLVSEEGDIDLIDWEYAGMGDYANDFGTFSVCEQLSEEEMREALTDYFGRTPTPQEWRHNLAQVGLAGWCWYVWALLKLAEGDDPSEWTYIYYRAGRTYLNKALALYENDSATS